MRPERFDYEMSRAFNNWFETHTAAAFKPLLREMKRVWVKMAIEQRDCRHGEETYGYESEDSIIHDMSYISDRWMVAFRLKWLIDGIEAGHIK